MAVILFETTCSHGDWNDWSVSNIEESPNNFFAVHKKFELSSKRKGIIAENQIFGIDSGWVGNKKWNHFAPGDATRQKA